MPYLQIKTKKGITIIKRNKRADSHMVRAVPASFFELSLAF